jgi:hypothetical protein
MPNLGLVNGPAARGLPPAELPPRGGSHAVEMLSGTPPGCTRAGVGFRWCRFARPPANSSHSLREWFPLRNHLSPQKPPLSSETTSLLRNHLSPQKPPLSSETTSLLRNHLSPQKPPLPSETTSPLGNHLSPRKLPLPGNHISPLSRNRRTRITNASAKESATLELPLRDGSVGQFFALLALLALLASHKRNDRGGSDGRGKIRPTPGSCCGVPITPPRKSTRQPQGAPA